MPQLISGGKGSVSGGSGYDRRPLMMETRVWRCSAARFRPGSGRLIGHSASEGLSQAVILAKEGFPAGFGGLG